MKELEQLNTNGILRKTQHKDHLESFYGKMFSGHSVCVDAYERDDEKWFVFLAPNFAGWTTDASIAFKILHNVSVYTVDELQ